MKHKRNVKKAKAEIPVCGGIYVCLCESERERLECESLTGISK